MYLIGYDIGSSTIKVALVDTTTDESVAVLNFPERDMDMISRQVGWAEQQPEVWWQYLCSATQKLLQQTKVEPKDIKGIGISYQMHGLVLVDKDLHVLRPSIIWCDSRAATIGRQAFNDLGHDFCLKNYLNSPGNFTAAKLKWVKDNEPDIYQKIYKILLPGDYIAMRMTGKVNTTISGLSEGVFWNFREKRMATQVLDYFGFDHDLIPEVTPTFSCMGEITKDAAIQTGLAAGTPVTYRAGDQPNNAAALNVLNQGEVAATSGTSGVVYGIVDKPLYDIKSRVNAFTHVNYEEHFDKIGILLCINGAGIQYSWIKHQIARGQTTYQDMDRMAATVPVGSEGICVLPFGNGSERIFEDQNLGSHFFNLRFNRHTRAHLYRAALEGVAFTFVHGIQILKKMGLEVDVIRVGNDNMFQSRIFSMTIATLLGSHIEVVETTGAIGAARASGVACGIYSSLEQALENVQPTRLYEPALDYAMCSKAYSYWQASLQKVLSQSKESAANSNVFKTQKDQLNKLLKEKNKIVAAQALELKVQNDILSKALKEIEKILKSANDSPTLKSSLKTLQGNLSSAIDSTNGLVALGEHLDLLSDDFIKNILAQYPSLSFEELKLCSFLKLKLRTKEIASRMNLSVRGVETKRYRLRKKLGLEKWEKTADFLESI